MAYLHSAVPAIVHRDLKSPNLLARLRRDDLGQFFSHTWPMGRGGAGSGVINAWLPILDCEILDRVSCVGG